MDRTQDHPDRGFGGGNPVPATLDFGVVSNWLALRGHRGRTRPLSASLAEEVARLLVVLDRWLQSQADVDVKELRPAFHDLAIAFRNHGFDVKATLEELGDLEDLILGDAPPLGDPPYQEGALPPLPRKLRRAMRALVAETVKLNHALDRRRHREDRDALWGFAEVLSHELGNRLGAARTGVELLQDPPQAMDAERRDEVLSLISAGIDAALNTVDDVTAYMDAQQWAEGDLVPFRDVAKRVVGGIAAMARLKGVRVEIGPSLPDVQVEGARLRLVLSNLLINGIRYADRGKETSWVQLHGWREGHDLHVEVSDNGVGIARGDQGRVFRYHERGGDETLSPEGRGLGLTIVREAIHQLGGEVRLESESGSGCTFQVTLPLGGPPSSLSGPPATP